MSNLPNYLEAELGRMTENEAEVCRDILNTPQQEQQYCIVDHSLQTSVKDHEGNTRVFHSMAAAKAACGSQQTVEKLAKK